MMWETHTSVCVVCIYRERVNTKSIVFFRLPELLCGLESNSEESCMETEIKVGKLQRNLVGDTANKTSNSNFNIFNLYC